MTKELKENIPEEDRLIIKKIKKYKVASKFYGSLAIIQGIISGAFGLASIYSFIRGIRKEYFYNSMLMTYPAGLLALAISVLAAIDIPEILEEREKYCNQVQMMKEEMLDDNNKRGVK